MKRGASWWTLVGVVLVSLLMVGQGRAEDEGQFFEATGQHLDNQYGFLDFWQRHNGAELYGPPITGIVLEANVPVQYFERGRLEQRDGRVVPGALGRERTRWRQFAAAPQRWAERDAQYFPQTRHVVAGAMLEFWRENHGATIFGLPLSEALWETRGRSSIRVQYFEHARLEEPSAGGRVVVSPLGREIALAKGLITPDQDSAEAIVEVAGSLSGEAAFAELAPPTPTPIPPTATPIPTARPIPPTATTAPEPKRQPAVAAKPQAVAAPKPTPTTRPALPGSEVAGKVIDVDLSSQRLVAMENGEVVYRAGVATGKDGFNTPTGTFTVYSKTKLRTMRGSARGEDWVVPNVPNVMYINGAVALHGTYWHNKFGTGVRMSHGCVNLSLKDAAWMYAWAPVGTRVIVHY